MYVVIAVANVSVLTKTVIFVSETPVPLWTASKKDGAKETLCRGTSPFTPKSKSKLIVQFANILTLCHVRRCQEILGVANIATGFFVRKKIVNGVSNTVVLPPRKW